MAGRRLARDVDIVLHADRHAVQRPARRDRRKCLVSGLARRIESALRIDPDESAAVRGFCASIAGEQRLHQLDRRETARRIGRADLGRRSAIAARSPCCCLGRIGGHGSAAPSIVGHVGDILRSRLCGGDDVVRELGRRALSSPAARAMANGSNRGFSLPSGAMTSPPGRFVHDCLGSEKIVGWSDAAGVRIDSEHLGSEALARTQARTLPHRLRLACPPCRFALPCGQE